MYRERIVVPDDILQALVQKARDYPEQVKTRFPAAMRDTLDQTLNRLRVEPSPPSYPYRWASERQRRAFFATNGFGRGIPTKRTGALLRGWDARIEPTPDGAQAVIDNNTPYTRFVQGEQQQPGHIATGWVAADDVIIEESIRLEDTLIDVFFEVVES